MTTVNKYSSILSSTERDGLKKHLIVNLLKDGVDVEFIQKWTGASKDEISGFINKTPTKDNGE